jgi:hypothetical protein
VRFEQYQHLLGSCSGTSRDINDLTGDEPRLLAGKERDDVGDVSWFADAANGYLASGALIEFFPGHADPMRRRVISVATNPGATAFAVMPKLPISIASVFVNPWRPALAVL